MDGSEFLAAHPDPVIHYAIGEGGVGVRRVNPAFEETFGDDGSEVALDDTLASAEAVEPVAGAIVQGDELDRDVECATETGRRTFRLRNVPRGDGGYLVYTDVSERVERERDLEARAERLETFASVVSHDLRNPIAIAERYVDAARRTGDEDDFERVTDAIDRMRTLVEDVLDLAREGKTIGDTERVALDAVVDAAWETVDTGSATLSVSDGSATLKADPDRLRQAVENLVRNAIEHGAADAVRVGTLDGDRAGFYVEDDGPGVPADERDEIFEAGVTSAAEGTGLGLAIVERVVDAHGWSVAVVDGSDGGARFEIDGVDSLQPF